MKPGLKTPEVFLPMIAVLCVLATGVSAQAPEATPPGAMLGDTCAGCHGSLGNPANRAIPPLAGMPSQVFVSLMQAYRSGTRPGAIMNRVATGYSDAELNEMAEYFANLPAAPPALTD